MAGALAALLPAEASAHGGATTTLDGAPTPPSPPGDGAKAEAILADVAARAKDAAAQKLVERPVHDAKIALERARGARVSGDETHAAMLDGLALELAESARDLERAAAAEVASLAAVKDARELGTKVERARTLLEETQARRGRAVAELQKAEADAKAASESAADAEQKRLEGKGHKAPAKKKKPAAKAAGKKNASKAVAKGGKR
jgi:hypothetical protein